MDKIIISKAVKVEIDIEDIVNKTMDTITEIVYDILYDNHLEEVFTDEEVYSIRWDIASAVAEAILQGK